MRSLLLFLFLIGFSSFSAAQSDSVATTELTAEATNDILTTQVYRKGLYKTFQEFRTNNPTVTDIPVEVVVRTKSDRYLAGGYGYKLYEMRNTKPLKGEYWGYCDGKNIYIRLKGDPINVEKLETLGLYCYYTDHAIQPSGASGLGLMFGAVGGVAIGVGGILNPGDGEAAIMNINTGNRARLTTAMVEKMLERDPELAKKIGPVKEYQGDRLEFIRQYNTRNGATLIKPF